MPYTGVMRSDPPLLGPPRLPTFGLALALALLASPAAPGADDIEPEAVRPGLLASYRSLVEADATLDRIDPKPAFSLGRSSLHPRLPSGPFEAAWDGLILVREPGPICFRAHLGGEVRMEVDGLTVLRGRGQNEAEPVGPAAALERPSPVSIGSRSITVRSPTSPRGSRSSGKGPASPASRCRPGVSATSRPRSPTRRSRSRGRNAVARPSSGSAAPAAICRLSPA